MEDEMRQHRATKAGVWLATLILTCSVASAQGSPPLDVDGIAGAIGKKGGVTGEMYKVTFPRSDLQVKIGALLLKPALALTSWAAFKKAGDAAIAYGDLVLLEQELNPVISELEKRGIEISALHNHLLHENPRVLYVHFMGHGNEVELARSLRQALDLTKTPKEGPPRGPEAKPDTAVQIEQIIGHTGNMAGGVFQVSVPRNDVHVRMMGTDIPGYMGMNTPLNFQIEGRKAAINGDFMLLGSEVNPVIKALRANGIEIASLHNHMLDAEPGVYFMHFWASGDALALAKGLKAALDLTGK
jgi:hypothetical protein